MLLKASLSAGTRWALNDFVDFVAGRLVKSRRVEDSY
jgi:hypothetical protein